MITNKFILLICKYTIDWMNVRYIYIYEMRIVSFLICT